MTGFFSKTTFGVDESLLYDELYKRGYAGAQAWIWTDSNHEKMLRNMKDVFTKYQKIWKSENRQMTRILIL